jgi:hypothetical protein
MHLDLGSMALRAVKQHGPLGAWSPSSRRREVLFLQTNRAAAERRQHIAHGVSRGLVVSYRKDTTPVSAVIPGIDKQPFPFAETRK